LWAKKVEIDQSLALILEGKSAAEAKDEGKLGAHYRE